MTHFKRFLSGSRWVTGFVVILGLLLVGSTPPLTAGEESGKGYLGVSIEKVPQDEKAEFGVTFGLLVTKVTKGEAAEKAGIKKYDVIQYFNGERMHRTVDLIEAVRACKPGTQAKVKLLRDGKEKELTVTLGEMKAKKFSFDWKDKEGKKFLFVSGGAYLGVHLQELSKDLAGYFGVEENGGALILKVEKDTPAEKAGLKAGDVIVKLHDKDISTPKDVTKTLAGLKEGDKVDIQVLRHQKKQAVKAELGKKPGLHGFKMLKGIGEGGKFHIEIPEIHYSGPDNEDIDIIIKEKVDKKMKKVQEKMEKVNEKLHKVQEKIEEVDEYVYI